MPKARPIVPEFVRDNVDALRELRNKKDLSAKDLSALVGINYSMIQHYEMGYRLPTRENYNKLAEYFGWQKWEV